MLTCAIRCTCAVNLCQHTHVTPHPPRIAGQWYHRQRQVCSVRCSGCGSNQEAEVCGRTQEEGSSRRKETGTWCAGCVMNFKIERMLCRLMQQVLLAFALALAVVAVVLLLALWERRTVPKQKKKKFLVANGCRSQHLRARALPSFACVIFHPRPFNIQPTLTLKQKYNTPQ